MLELYGIVLPVPLVTIYTGGIGSELIRWLQIARIQPREYTLRATGWVRTVSGVQSLISVYLVALWVLSYFGRPFEAI